MESPQVHESLRNPPATLPLAERVNFQSVFEGLFVKALGPVSPLVKQELKAVGVDLDRLQAAYPHTVLFAALDVASRHWFPGEPVQSAYLKLGLRNVEGFFETPMGRPLLALLKLMGVKRTLGRMRTNLRSANNYADAKLAEVSATEFQLWVNEPGDFRFFTQGVIQGGVRLTGAPNGVVTVIDTNELGTVYQIKL